MERHIEEINGNVDRLDLRKNEIVQLENQFAHIKRLEDEVNNKMNRFINEKNRIDQMKNDFDRLIKTSESVDERLKHVTSSDDILQAVQVQIRKLEDGIKENEEKFQRIERKNDVLEETKEGIDRNFKTLQKTEAAIKNAQKVIHDRSDQFDSLHAAIEALAAENRKATEASEKISILDENLSQIEKRIEDMNVAREWLARTETELKALDKDAREYVKLAKGIFEKDKGKGSAATGKGAPPPRDRDNVLKLKEQGWTVEEISNSMKMSRAEVELIIEIGSRG
jgi:DNA repair exonuclease SbcCD ATPase subunit